MNADGSGVVQVTHDGAYADDPRFTADGHSVVYESKNGGNWEIRRVGVDGSGEVNLTRNRASDRYPAVSPNGRLVAFSSNRGSTGTHIWVMNIQGGALKQVTVRKGNQFEPAWAPSGGRLAYVSGTLRAGTNLWTVLANGKGDRALTALHADEQLNPSWSPDGHSIVYQDCGFESAAPCTLSVMPLQGKPVDISPLRAPYIGHLRRKRDGRSTRERVRARQRHHDQCRERATCRNCRRGRRAGRSRTTTSTPAGGPGASWSATSTCRPTTHSSSGRRLTASPRRSTPSGRDSKSSARAKPGARTTCRPSTRASTRYRHCDSVGALRLQRAGTTAVASYLSNTGWVAIASDLTTVDPAIIDLEASQHGRALRPPGGQDRLGQPTHQLRQAVLPDRLCGRTTHPTGNQAAERATFFAIAGPASSRPDCTGGMESSGPPDRDSEGLR